MRKTFALPLVLLLVTTIGLPVTLDAQTLDNEIQRVFSWLPADTETVVVADSRKRSFLDLDVFDKKDDEDEQKDEQEAPPASVQDVAARFQVLPMGFFFIGNKALLELFRTHPLAFTIEGSRHFRGPRAGLGLMDYEACEIAVFKEDVHRHGEWLLERNKERSAKEEKIAGHAAVLFEEDWEATWTLYVVFPQPDVLMVCSNRDYTQEVLNRMELTALDRALPPSLPEWKYVNTGAPFWGLRHFDRSQAELDPSSPFGGPKSANSPDEQGIGVTFSFDPNKSNTVTVIYLSGDPEIKEKLRHYETKACSEDHDEGVLVSSAQLRPGIIQYSYSFPAVAHLGLFFFFFEAVLGHGTYV